MQGGQETSRGCPATGSYRPTACTSPGGHGPKACPLLPLQTLGGSAATDQLGEGSGDSFSAREGCCPQEATSNAGAQGAAAAGPTREAQGASPQ
eukprot:3098221-Amphidinium_carterae.1